MIEAGSGALSASRGEALAGQSGTAGTRTSASRVALALFVAIIGGMAWPRLPGTATAAEPAALTVRTFVDRTAASPGDLLTFTTVIENGTAVAATGIDVDDDLSGVPGDLVAASTSASWVGSHVRWSNLTIRAGTTETLTYAIRLSREGWRSGETVVGNQVSVTRSDCAGSSTSDACAARVTVTVIHGLVVTKEVAASASGPFAASATAAAGDPLWFLVRARNTGNASLTGFRIADSQGLPADQCDDVPERLGPDEAYLCVYRATAEPGTSVNIAVAVANEIDAVSASATVTAAGASLSPGPTSGPSSPPSGTASPSVPSPTSSRPQASPGTTAGGTASGAAPTATGNPTSPPGCDGPSCEQVPTASVLTLLALAGMAATAILVILIRRRPDR